MFPGNRVGSIALIALLFGCSSEPSETSSNATGGTSSGGGSGSGGFPGGGTGGASGSGGSGGTGGSGGSTGGGYVTTNGTQFSRDGAKYRFVGANLRGLTHYGHGDALPYADAEQIALNLSSIQGMGGRVVRAFVSYRELDAQATGDRLAAVLDELASKDLTLIVVLTDFYATGFNPAGDDGFYASDLNGFTVLNHAFFQSGYAQSYKPQVEALVARFQNHPAIFSWELGNEIRDATFADSTPATFIAFCKDMAGTIRGLDSNHMISVGEISALGNGMSKGDAAQIYGDPNISFLTMRSYDGGNTDDTGFAAGLGKPIIVEEAGISGGDRPAELASDLQKWFGKGTRGYLQWGFSAAPNDNGDGDTQFGMDKVWHANDWDGMHSAYQSFAQTL